MSTKTATPTNAPATAAPLQLGSLTDLVPRTFPYQQLTKVQARILLCLDYLTMLCAPCGYPVAELVPSVRTAAYMGARPGTGYHVDPNVLFDHYRAAAMLDLDRLEQALPVWPSFHDVAQQAASDIAHWLHGGRVGQDIKVVDKDKGSKVKTVATLASHIKENADAVPNGDLHYKEKWFRHFDHLVVLSNMVAPGCGAGKDAFEQALAEVGAPTADGYVDYETPVRLQHCAIDMAQNLSAVHLATATYMLANPCPWHLMEDLLPGGLSHDRYVMYFVNMRDALDNMLDHNAFRYCYYESVTDVMLHVSDNAPGTRAITNAAALDDSLFINTIGPDFVSYNGGYIPTVMARYGDPLAYDVVVNTAKTLLKVGVVGTGQGAQ